MIQDNLLALERCPYCQISKPRLEKVWSTTTNSANDFEPRNWVIYSCSSCGGVVLTGASLLHSSFESVCVVDEIYPTPKTIHDTVPERARLFLIQAIESIHAPAGAMMLAASSIDAMLKEKGYKDGNLFQRIEKAANDHLITKEMADWAHEIRLDANEQRHADEEAPLPNKADAQRGVEFAEALAQFLFVLPARVASGRRNIKKQAEQN